MTTPHPASTAPAAAHAAFRSVTRRDGGLCRTAGCWDLATVLTPADPAVRLVDAVRLPAEDMTAVCAVHADEADRAGRRTREAAAAAALASTQLDLFT
ncbi:hypothetical protein AB0O57_32520 [Streptomyces sp. NPDC091201]|uniref:hypothetical protein n=1 Tax=Streptomyces sp. NPDC091201 TaxID=3155190 RepID=UPI00342821B3